MKPRIIDPRWALWMGYVVAPLATALDHALLQWNSSALYPLGCLYTAGICALFTVPQGWLSAYLLDSWRLGEYARVRIWCLAAGLAGIGLLLLFCIRFSWYFLPSALVSMPFPICWSLLFLLAAFASRSPK